MVYKFFDKKSKVSGIVNEMANELHKPIINWKMSFINQLLENSKNETFIRYLEAIFGVLI